MTYIHASTHHVPNGSGSERERKHVKCQGIRCCNAASAELQIRCANRALTTSRSGWCVAVPGVLLGTRWRVIYCTLYIYYRYIDIYCILCICIIILYIHIHCVVGTAMANNGYIALDLDPGQVLSSRLLSVLMQLLVRTIWISWKVNLYKFVLNVSVNTDNCGYPFPRRSILFIWATGKKVHAEILS